MIEHPREASSVSIEHAVENALAEYVEPTVLDVLLRYQNPRAHHRRGRKRDDHGHENCAGKRNRELAEQATNYATHEKKRNEHGDQRQTDRQDGEADLLCAFESGLYGCQSFLEVPRDVFHHDDRIVHYEAARDRQRHEREIVERKTAYIHDRAGPDQRNRDSNGRDERRRDVPQENEDDGDDKHDADDKGSLEIGAGGSNRGWPLE